MLEKWEQHTTSDEFLPKLKLWLYFSYAIRSDGPVDHHFNVLSSSAARRYLDSDLTGLPIVRRISSFKIDVKLGKSPHPDTICRIARLFPRLQELNIDFRDPAVKRHEMREEHRVAMAAGLRELRTLPRLAKLSVRRQGGWDPANHSFMCQDLEDEEHVDVLCESIRQLAEAGRLTDLKLENILVSPDLFRNRRSGGTLGDKPLPAMRRFHVKDDILSPSGKWYYTGDPDAVEAGSPRVDIDSADDDSGNDSDSSNDGDDVERDVVANGERPVHLWRTRPDPETFDPLITDMANAMHRMPAREWGCLDIGSDLEEPFAVIVQCAQRGQGSSGAQIGSRIRRWVRR